ncbi:MAG: SLC13 family permease [Microcystis aeruginosa K13-05]|jgi:di/tricarboxylate transporter|uniref:SLC13 family permease n=1 Tax=unclassified Microcystis TaxID=2643300 RepID=UPI0022C166F0|nr:MULTISPECIES: SLC13 family permease [unclassified Microcystis]NCR81370.1 SLC13 family permease [Microcystis aeruginosa K13-10]NCR86021.1 SLC13 family permease [Microcystis aeruginosa K13-05]MCZ8048689.1 SLC13 family permease [Microcystis sp. LE19-41.2A]MCZ8288808.1 SLC13 family permease [Microcystis sp. LE19-59.1C]MDJ0537924.1 SLC13 family permease [Microcystis sp. M53603_WE2]
MPTPIILTLTVLVVALVAFVAEWLPVDLTALCVAIVLILLGLVTPEEGIAGFSNAATVTVMAMFVLSAGITRTGVIQVIRDRLLVWGGKNPHQQVFVLGALVGPISAFINNTAVVAIFLPIVEDWCKKQKISPSKLLIPLSYATVLAGMITVVGTSTNILASGISAKLGYGEFSLFQFTALGLVTFLAGLIYLTIFAPKLLPDRKSSTGEFLDDDYGSKVYLSEVIVTPRSNLIGQTLSQSGLQRKFDFDVLELIRNKVHLPQPLADKVLNAGDILIVHSSREELLKIKDERGLEIFADLKFQKEDIESVITTGEEKLAEVLILSNSRLIGTTLKDLKFRQRYNATVLAIRRGSELLQGRLGKIPLKFGDLLLVQGPKQSFIGLQTTRELLVLEEKEIESQRQDKGIIALIITLSVIIIAAFDIQPILVTSLVGVVLMVITGCLKPGEVYGSIRWDIIFLLAGLIPLGTAMDNSGTTKWLADNLVAIGGNLSGFWILVFFYLITSVLTEILSNNAAVVLMIPVAVEVAKTLGLNPLAFMYAVTFAASNSYLTPIGYQTNTMVYAPGGYKFLDFTRLGAPLNLILTFLTPSLIVLFYGLK